MSVREPPGNSLCSMIVAFLEPWVHTILRLRKIYPESTFERCSVFGASNTFKNRHPEVVTYIHNTVQELHSVLEQGVISRVVVCLMCDGERMEEFVLEFGLLQQLQLQPGDARELYHFFGSSLKHLDQVCCEEAPMADLEEGQWTWRIEAHTYVPDDVLPMWTEEGTEVSRRAGLETMHAIRSLSGASIQMQCLLLKK